MKEIEIGGFVRSVAGHDLGKCYVIFQIDAEYVYLVDGKIRTLDRPKKKKKKHITFLSTFDPDLANKITAGTVKNEEIKRAIKLLLIELSSKEVE